MKLPTDIFAAELDKMPREQRIELSNYSFNEILTVLWMARAEKSLARYMEHTADVLFALQDLQKHYEKEEMPDHALIAKSAFTAVERFYDDSLESMTKDWDKTYAFMKKSSRKIDSL